MLRRLEELYRLFSYFTRWGRPDSGTNRATFAVRLGYVYRPEPGWLNEPEKAFHLLRSSPGLDGWSLSSFSPSAGQFFSGAEHLAGGACPNATPLPNARELNRTNCVEILLGAYFQSNEVVKALVFMPGATDELYLFRRARAVLTASNSSLHDAVAALTNQTFIHATFRTPFLLLHTGEDPIEPDNTIQDQGHCRRSCDGESE